MKRQSISFTEPNDEWLTAQVESKEYSSKSEVVNDLIRRARKNNREAEYIRAKLIASEQSVQKEGWVEDSPQEIRDGFKTKARNSGKL